MVSFLSWKYLFMQILLLGTWEFFLQPKVADVILLAFYSVSKLMLVVVEMLANHKPLFFLK